VNRDQIIGKYNFKFNTISFIIAKLSFYEVKIRLLNDNYPFISKPISHMIGECVYVINKIIRAITNI